MLEVEPTGHCYCGCMARKLLPL